jgi:hypothetical protein
VSVQELLLSPHKICEVKMENEDLVMPVSVETKLKQMIVNYIGERLSPEDPNITVQMVVEVFAAEFPEFLLVVAEENFLRGYEQALTDIQLTTRETKSV